MTDCIGVIYVEIETEVSDLSNWVRFVMKIKQENDMTDHTGTVYVEDKTELSWPIKSSAIYLTRCYLWLDGITTLLIVWVKYTPKMILKCQDW